MFAVRIQGKSDEEEVILCIWRDDDVPELCLVRALLAWVSLSGYQGGYLFPNPKDKSLAMDAKTFLRQCSKVCKTVTGRSGPFGTHVCRKTGWCLATWGGASDVDMALASRHRSQQMAARYKKDASTLLEIAKNQP
jgi:integrase